MRGAEERLAPILMTGLATSLALLPIMVVATGRATRSNTRWRW
jgi:Cu/Ag efflux pump CusA